MLHPATIVLKLVEGLFLFCLRYDRFLLQLLRGASTSSFAAMPQVQADQTRVLRTPLQGGLGLVHSKVRLPHSHQNKPHQWTELKLKVG